MTSVNNELNNKYRSFIGKVLATFSHELKNHLAIIKEYSGLMHDLIEIGKIPNKDDNGQYIKSIRSIHQQIERSTGFITFFNRFCHRMDNPISSFNIQEALQELITLIQRLANQKRIVFKIECPPEAPVITNNPSLVQMIFFCMFESAAERLPDGGTITWRISSTGDTVSVIAEPSGISEYTTTPPLRICTEETAHEAAQFLGGVLTTTGEFLMLKLPF